MSEKPEKSWSLSITRAREALSRLGPLDWGDMAVAHIDTGITPHPVLGDWVMPARGVNYMENGAPPIDPLAPDAFNAGHGTKTCSVLTGFLAGTFVGVAPKLPVIPYRVTNVVVLASDKVRTNIANAIRHAVDHNACSVISISLGYPQMGFFHNALGEALDHAYDHGVIVCAAGGQVVDRFCYPGKFFRAIGVGGFTGNPGRERIYQDYTFDLNAFADVWAPADPIWRAEAVRDLTTQENVYSYGFGDGTSYATPHVAAAAAMWLKLHGEELLSLYKHEHWLRVEAFRLLLKRSARDIKALPGLEATRPALADEVPPRKGDCLGQNIISGGLDIYALLGAPLPDRDELPAEPLPPAAKQWG